MPYYSLSNYLTEEILGVVGEKHKLPSAIKKHPEGTIILIDEIENGKIRKSSLVTTLYCDIYRLRKSRNYI